MQPEKVEHERKVFLEFAVVAGFELDHGVVQCCLPPEPDLVLYYDNENALVGDVPVFDTLAFRQHAGQVMQPLREQRPNVFHRVWVYERHRRSVLWCYQQIAG